MPKAEVRRLRHWSMHFGRTGPLATATAVIALAVVFIGVRADADGFGPASVSSTVTVERAPGQLVLDEVFVDERGHIEVVVIDTRAEDPGWSVQVVVENATAGATMGLAPLGGIPTRRFSDGSGVVYAQQVTAGAPVAATRRTSLTAILGSAPAGHGLGVARLRGTVTGNIGQVRATVTFV